MSVDVERGKGRRRRTEVEEEQLVIVFLRVVAAKDEEVGADLGGAVAETAVRALSLDIAPRERFCMRKMKQVSVRGVVARLDPRGVHAPRLRTQTSGKHVRPSLPPTTTILCPTTLAVWYPLGAGFFP